MIILKLIERNDYLERLINVIGTPDIKVLTGIRRSGKSKLLESFKKYITNNITNSNIIHINYNLLRYEQESDHCSGICTAQRYNCIRHCQGGKPRGNFICHRREF